MTKRLVGALVCALAMFAVGGVATAQAKRLSYKDAKSLATALAAKQVRGRDVVSFHVHSPVRVSPNRFVFSYDDRTAGHAFCTARLVVTSTTSRSKTTISARFTGQHCAGIPSEVLKFEALVRRAQRDVKANTAATVQALGAVVRSSKRCRNVKVPRSKRRDAQALFGVALVEALERPNDAALGNFVNGLLNLQVSNAKLAAGASAWADYLAAARALPTVDDPCAALKTWKRAGFTAGSEPIDFAAVRSLDERATADLDVIDKAAILMAAKGAFPNAAVGFAPDGLLSGSAQLVAGAGARSQRGKLVLR
jgi:hypothetical protein